MRQGSPVVSEPSEAAGASGTGEPGGRILRPLSCNRSGPVLGTGVGSKVGDEAWTGHKKRPWSHRCTTQLADTVCVVITHQTGMTVAEVTDLRRQMRAAGASFKVTKNRLARLALDRHEVRAAFVAVHRSDRDRLFAGPGGGGEGGRRVRQQEREAAIVGGGLGEQQLDAAGVKALATLPSLDQLRAKLLGMLQTPATRIASVLQAPGGQIARVLGAYARQGGRLVAFKSSKRLENIPGVLKWLILNKLVDELSSLTVIEAAELSKLLEEKWGVSAAAPVAVAAAAVRRRRAGRSGGREDRIHRRPGRGRRQEDQRDQGGARDHRSRPEGGQGPGRGRAEAGQGRRQQGRGGEDQEAARRRGCDGSNSIAPRGIALAGRANGGSSNRPCPALSAAWKPGCGAVRACRLSSSLRVRRRRRQRCSPRH